MCTFQGGVSPCSYPDCSSASTTTFLLPPWARCDAPNPSPLDCSIRLGPGPVETHVFLARTRHEQHFIVHIVTHTKEQSALVRLLVEAKELPARCRSAK